MLVSFVLQIAVRGLPDRGSSLLQDLFSRFSFLFSPSVVRLLSTLSTICPYVRLSSDVVPSQFFFRCDLLRSFFFMLSLFPLLNQNAITNSYFILRQSRPFSDNLHLRAITPTILNTQQLLHHDNPRCESRLPFSLLLLLLHSSFVPVIT